MNYQNTNLGFLQMDCIKIFGEEKGNKIFNETCQTYYSLLQSINQQDNNESIKMHIEKNMFPTIAYYLALQKFGYTKDEAYEFVLNETQKAALIKQKKNKALGKMPFAYRIFKLFFKKVMRKNFPNEGWQIEWKKFDSKEIHINFTKCLYVDYTSKYGCPELCSVFCKNDIVSFEGYKPKIDFRRTQTLANSEQYCDFHFYNGIKE